MLSRSASFHPLQSCSSCLPPSMIWGAGPVHRVQLLIFFLTIRVCVQEVYEVSDVDEYSKDFSRSRMVDQ